MSPALKKRLKAAEIAAMQQGKNTSYAEFLDSWLSTIPEERLSHIPSGKTGDRIAWPTKYHAMLDFILRSGRKEESEIVKNNLRLFYKLLGGTGADETVAKDHPPRSGNPPKGSSGTR